MCVLYAMFVANKKRIRRSSPKDDCKVIRNVMVKLSQNFYLAQDKRSIINENQVLNYILSKFIEVHKLKILLFVQAIFLIRLSSSIVSFSVLSMQRPNKQMLNQNC